MKKHFVPSEYHLNYLRMLKPETSFRAGEDPYAWQKNYGTGWRKYWAVSRSGRL